MGEGCLFTSRVHASLLVEKAPKGNRAPQENKKMVRLEASRLSWKLLVENLGLRFRRVVGADHSLQSLCIPVANVSISCHEFPETMVDGITTIDCDLPSTGRRRDQRSMPRLHTPAVCRLKELLLPVSVPSSSATQAEPRTDVRIKPSAAAEPPATAAGTERPRSIVPTSLLIDIEETRATVQALAAGAVTVPFQEPLTDSEQATAIGATTSGRGEGLGLANPGQLQPKPPDTTRYQRSEPSFDHQTGSTARRRRSGMPPAQEPGGGASTAESSPGGADGSQRERRPEEASGSAQNETPESSSEAGQAPIGGNRRTGSGSGGSAGIALPAGGADEKGGDGGDGSGDRAYGRPPPRSGRHGVDDYYRPRNKPPEEIATDPPIREQGGGRNFMPATDENPPLALLAGEGVGEQGRRSPSPSGSCSGSSSTPARIGRGGVVNKAGGDAGEEPSLAEDVVAAGTDGTSPAHPAGGSDDDDGGVVVAVGDAMIQKRGTTGGTAAEDMPREEAVEELTPQEGSN